MGAGFTRHELLHQPVLEGVEGHDNESACGRKPAGGLFEDERKFFKLLIDENP